MEEQIVEQTLEIAEEKWKLLKGQSYNTQMSTRTTLELASHIRDSISRNEELTELINANEEYASRRKKLLDEIRKMQLDIIVEHAKPGIDLGNLDGNIKDFNKAKQDMVVMIETEQSLHTEIGSQELFKTIKDFKIHEQTLRKIVNDCKNRRYEVLIIGDFQSGKSTTIDALCDGHYVSAIGEGLATSAVLTSITYDDKEHAVIHWRTKERLTSLFDNVRQYLPDFDFKTFDLDNPKARKKLAAAIKTLRTSEECTNIDVEDAKFLMLCDFVLEYYGTPELSKKKEALKASAQPAEITKFPPKGETLWKKQGITGFTIDEVLFVFIERVDCFVHSETLQRLNCTLIDSPGLFNSSYDTMITQQAMVNANVIMYVLPYYRGLDQDVCKSLCAIKRKYPDVLRKLFIVNNLGPGMQKVFESNCEVIKDMFSTEKEVYRYDAKLAYLLQIKRLYDSGQASKRDYQHLLKVKVESYFGDKEMVYTEFPKAWESHIAKYKDALSGNCKDIETGLKASGFIDMTDALQNFIESNEAYLIIVSNGLALMVREIVAIRKSLYRSYIEPYIYDQEDVEKLWENRIMNAEVFQNFVTESLNKKIFEDGEVSLFLRMAQEGYDKLFTDYFYEELSHAIAEIIYDNKKFVISLKAITNKEEYTRKLIKKLTPPINDQVIILLYQKLSYFNYIIESEQNMMVRNMFAPEMKNVEYSCEKKWYSLYGNDKEFRMKDFFILSKGLKPADKVYDPSYDNNIDYLPTDGSTIVAKGAAAQSASTVAGMAASIAAYIGLIVFDPTGITQGIVLGIALLIVAVYGIIAGVVGGEWAKEKCIKKLAKLLKSQVKTDENVKCFKLMLESQLRLIISKYIAAQNIEIKKMKNERDSALHPTADIEDLCFRSIETYKQIDEQLRIYEKYKQEHLTYETT